MTIFSEDDLAEVPVLQRWSIFVGEQGRPFVTGQHAFHEGVRTAIDEVLVVDPLLRWVVTNHGGYRLAASLRAPELAESASTEGTNDAENYRRTGARRL